MSLKITANKNELQTHLQIRTNIDSHCQYSLLFKVLGIILSISLFPEVYSLYLVCINIYLSLHIRYFIGIHNTLSHMTNPTNQIHEKYDRKARQRYMRQQG